jgi:hypothetical protein
VGTVREGWGSLAWKGLCFQDRTYAQTPHIVGAQGKSASTDSTSKANCVSPGFVKRPNLRENALRTQ